MESLPKLALIVPCYNEEEVLEQANKAIISLLDQLIESKTISSSSFVLYVDDGSKDTTWQMISGFQLGRTAGVRLSRNFGHQAALLAGYHFVQDRSDCSISIDADLQHDISKIPEFITLFKLGFEIVLGVKTHRGKESLFKKVFSLGFYRLMIGLGVKITKNHADFRLQSNRVTKEVLKFGEVNLFLRGLIGILGFSVAEVPYVVKNRELGQSKYSLGKMVSLALNGITSFSIQPLRFLLVVGLGILGISLLASIYIVFQKFYGKVVPGWASIVLPIYFIGAIQMIGLGIMGEYLGKIYLESKRRPLYSVWETKPLA